MSRLADVPRLGLPEDLAKAVLKAIDKTEASPDSADAFAAMKELAGLSLVGLRDLALSAYVAGFGIDDANSEGIRQDCRTLAAQTMAGDSLRLFSRCMTTLHRRYGGAPFLLQSVRTDSAKNGPDVECFCAFWEELKRCWTSSAKERFDDYKKVIAEVQRRPRGKKYSLYQFFESWIECRNASEHTSEPTEARPVMLDLSEDFYSTVNACLAPALSNHMCKAAEVLGRYLACSVLDVLLEHATDSPASRVARVKPPRQEPQFTIKITDARVKRGSWWYVDMESRQFCFPVLHPSDVISQEPPMVGTSVLPTLSEPVDDRQPSPSFYSLSLDVRRGLFTPVLGPGCYRVRSNLSNGLKHVGERAEQLRSRLTTKAERGYVDSVIKGGTGSDCTPEELTDLDVSTVLPFEKGDLLRLQIALVRLGVGLTEVFAEAMGRHIQAVTDLTGFSVRIESAETAGKVVALLDVACKSAENLSRNVEVQGNSVRLGLGAPGIRDRLNALRSTLAEQSPEIDLQLTLLEWVGDLLWHTLRFRAPMYPAPDDLAFQLSVCQPAVAPLPKKHTVGAAASAFEEEDLAQYIGEWVRNWAPVTEHGSSTFDVAMARALWHAMAPTGGVLQTSASGGGAVDAVSMFVPIALDTTFEDGIEQAFRDGGLAHHVVFPAELDNDDPFGDGPKEGWILYSDLAAEGRRWSYLDSEIDPETLRGPLVVKLNGAPLTPLPAKGELIGLPRTTARHRIVASYAEVLRAVGSDLALPPGLERLLIVRKTIAPRKKRSRVLCFLGFRLTDSNSRLRIYGLRRVSAARGADPDGPFRTLFVDSPRDPVQHAFLKLDQQLLVASLDQVAARILDTDGLKPLPQARTRESR